MVRGLPAFELVDTPRLTLHIVGFAAAPSCYILWKLLNLPARVRLELRVAEVDGEGPAPR